MTTPTSPATRARGPRSRFRRRWAGALTLGLGLLLTGTLASALTPSPQAASAEGDSAQLAKGQVLYQNSCISCHGANLQGVKDHGPSLIGVGDAAVYFQVSSGRMPMARQEAQARRKPPLPALNPETPEGAENLAALGAYVQANGGGPVKPQDADMALRGPNPARGGELFRLNCASCHNFTGRGGALSSGKFAPNLDETTDAQVYTAMLTGPQNMPRFSDRQLTPDEKKDIVAYVKSVGGGYNNNPGGDPLGGIGPVSEGLMAFIFGLVAVTGFAMWLGAKN
jgi:ubiquinol-cytochrome c reductase cytochrome c subunit